MQVNSGAADGRRLVLWIAAAEAARKRVLRTVVAGAVRKLVLWTVVAAGVEAPRVGAVSASAAKRFPEAVVAVTGAAAPWEATPPLVVAEVEAGPEPAAHEALQAWGLAGAEVVAVAEGAAAVVAGAEAEVAGGKYGVGDKTRYNQHQAIDSR
jgi:hypothetical protein